MEICKVKSKKTESEPIASHSTIQSKPNIHCSTNHSKQEESSATFKLVVASVSKKYALSFVDKSSATLKLVVASVTNKDLKGSTNASLTHFEQLLQSISMMASVGIPPQKMDSAYSARKISS